MRMESTNISRSSSCLIGMESRKVCDEQQDVGASVGGEGTVANRATARPENEPIPVKFNPAEDIPFDPQTLRGKRDATLLVTCQIRNQCIAEDGLCSVGGHWFSQEKPNAFS